MTFSWKPLSKPQSDFLAATEFEVLYGGAKGGAKTESLIVAPLQQISNPRFKCLLLREVYSELQEIQDRTQRYYGPLGAVWEATQERWRFPSGALIRIGYCQDQEDVRRYQGQEWTFIGYDELGNLKDELVWDSLLAEIRSPDPALIPMARATANPGGKGHGWLKRRFVVPTNYGTMVFVRELGSLSSLVSQGSASKPVGSRLGSNPSQDSTPGPVATTSLASPAPATAGIHNPPYEHQQAEVVGTQELTSTAGTSGGSEGEALSVAEAAGRPPAVSGSLLLPKTANFFSSQKEASPSIRMEESSAIDTDDQLLLSRRFIPSRVTDNPIYANDKRYMAQLYALPEVARRQLLFGDWNAGEGLALEELNRDIHLLKAPVVPGPYDYAIVGFDWGYGHPWRACLVCLNALGRGVLVDTVGGHRQRPDEIAERLTAWLQGHFGALALARVNKIVGGKDCFHEIRSRGENTPSIAEQMYNYNGLRMEPANISRIFGLNNMRLYLAWKSPNGEPKEPRLKLALTPGNLRLLSVLEDLVVDPDRIEDVLKVDANPVTGIGGDDDYDALRYALASRPLSGQDAPDPPESLQDKDPLVLDFDDYLSISGNPLSPFYQLPDSF